MRLPEPTPPTPIDFTLDVLIAQNCGLPATGFTVRQQATGGSEWQVVVLAEALAARGYKVGVVSPVPFYTRAFGVDYIPIGEVLGRKDFAGNNRPTAHVRAEVMISERFAPLIPLVEFSRAVFELHDLPDERLGTVIHLMNEISESRVVVHSEFMRSLLPEWPRVEVIPCMLPDEFYEQPAPVDWSSIKTDKEYRRRYVYGSAAMKGLEPTLALWRELKRTKEQAFRHAMLIVTSPGYDQINPEWLKDCPGVFVQTGKSPAEIQRLLAHSDGIFMVSTYPETFGIIFAQCEAAGKVARVLRAHKQADALDTTTTSFSAFPANTTAEQFVADFSDERRVCANDFRVSSHIDRWIDVLGLKQPKEKAA